ncbi:MAG TPA: response regulator transcription factor [Acidimicrobiia bacterium]|nr:response regulator transcription factor [Acidimicrobiia bacterium]
MTIDSVTDDTRCGRLDASAIGLLVVHNEVLFRQGLCALLAEEPDIAVVADVVSAGEAVQLDVTPHVIVADVVPSDTRENNVVHALAARFEDVPIVVVGPVERLDLAQAAIASGATGYLTATATYDELVAALRSVAQGQSFLQPSMGVALAQWDADRVRAAGKLSKREREVLRWIALGFTNREISVLLETSLRTVESQRASVVGKLGFGDRPQLVRYAHRAGLLDIT